MTTDTLDLPTIADPAPAAAPTLPATTDLKKVDLQAVALAQFGDWRADVAAAKQNLGTLALDLTIPARIAEAKSLRQRLINAPIADARAVSKALKSKLTQVSKAVGAEEEAAVTAYTDAGALITPKIEAAEQAIENARLERERKEAERKAEMREKVNAIMDAWIKRSQAEGMTSERLAAGIEAFKALKVPPELADVDTHWFTAHAATLSALDHAYLSLRSAEVEAAQAKLRAEAQRVAGIQQRIAEIQAAATGHDKASAADLAEARAIVAALRVDADTYAEFLPLAQAAQANTALTLGRLYDEAVARELRESEEAAERARLAAIAALPPAPPPQCELSDAGVTAPEAQEGVAQNSLQLEPVNESAGDLAADGAGDGSQSAATPPTPAADSVIGNTIFKVAQLAELNPMAGAEGRRYAVSLDDDAPLETSEADARPYVAPIAAPAPAPAPAEPRDEFVALVMTAFDCKFPSHPKPSQEWWAKVRAAGQQLQGLAA